MLAEMNGGGTMGTNGPTNPYAPPALDALTEPSREERGDRVHASSEYYVVATSKFYALALSTYGIYLAYWFYAHFRARSRSGKRLGPAVSALFSVFTVHGLFRGFEWSAREAGLSSFRAAAHSVPYIVLILSSRVLRRLVPNTVGQLLAFGLVLACSVPLGQAQLVANRLAGDPHGSTNARFGIGTLVALGFGFVLTALAVYGAMPDE